MPTLDGPALRALHVQPVTQCPKCLRWTRPNYCRQCDVFFDAGHMGAECCPDDTLHDTHRTY